MPTTPRSNPNPDDPAFREHVIQRLLREQLPVETLAREFGLDVAIVETWKQDFLERLRTATKAGGSVSRNVPKLESSQASDKAPVRGQTRGGPRRVPTSPIVEFPVKAAPPANEEQGNAQAETRRLILEEGKVSGDGRKMGMLPARVYENVVPAPFEQSGEPPTPREAISGESQSRFSQNWEKMGALPVNDRAVPDAAPITRSEKLAEGMYKNRGIGWLMRGCSFDSAPWALALLVLVVAGTVYVLISQYREEISQAPVIDPGATPLVFQPVTRAEFEAIEPLIRQFYGASSVQELEPLIRFPQIVRPLLENYYGGVVLNPKPVHSIANPTRQESLDRPFIAIEVRSGPLSSPTEIIVEQTDEGPKIDWETSVDYQAMPWPIFQRTKPRQPVYFRVQIQLSSVYIEPFDDPATFRSYRVAHPNEVRSFSGFARIDSAVDKDLRDLIPKRDSMARVIIGLRYPEGPASEDNDLVEITELLYPSWIVDYTGYDRHFDLASP